MTRTKKMREWNLTHSGVCRDCNEWVCEGWCPYGLVNLARKREMDKWAKKIGEELSAPAGSIQGKKKKKKKPRLVLVSS